jgi:hypothetical protein
MGFEKARRLKNMHLAHDFTLHSKGKEIEIIYGF